MARDSRSHEEKLRAYVRRNSTNTIQDNLNRPLVAAKKRLRNLEEKKQRQVRREVQAARAAANLAVVTQ